MGRGFVFGGFWGLLTGGVVLAVASLLGEVPGDAPKADVLEVPAGSGFQAAGEDRPAEVGTQEESQPAVTEAPLVTSPEAPPAPTLGSDVTTPAAVPEAGAASELAPPPDTEESSGVVVSIEGPAEPVAPETTANESAPSVTAEIEAPQQAPDVTTVDPEAPQAPTGDATADVSTPDDTPVPEATIVDGVPVVIVEDEDIPEVATAPAAAPVGEEEALAEAETSEIENENAPEETPEQEVAEAPEEDQAGPVVEPTQVAPPASTAGFGNLAENVQTGRLPTIGGDQPEEEVTVPKAIEDFAGTFPWSGPDDRPLMAFVLIDEGGDAKTFDALASFEHPLTFAIPGSGADVQQAMQAYRSAGHEVAVILDVPTAAAPADVEIALEGSFATVPEAMAVLDGTFSGFNGDRRVTNQVAEALAASGHGLLTFEQGLNSTAQTAARAGVPVGTVFRELDRDGQDARVIGRFLDQAAFRAAQEGGVVLLGRMRAETISAMLIWQQQARADRVNIAPLSAVLLSDQ